MASNNAVKRVEENTTRTTFQPYIPASSQLPELTVKAVLLGCVLAAVLGAANAYLGLKAGQTVSAVFPAAVIAMACFRLPFMRGNILEENITRTAASVGEVLAAGAVFVLPAFLMVEVDGQKLWSSFHYWESTILILAGGLLGLLCIIVLRRALAVEANLPFPEGKACYEMTKAGQTGETGVSYLFKATGIAALAQLLTNSRGFSIFKEVVEKTIHFPSAAVRHLDFNKKPLADVIHEGTITFTSPLCSMAMMGVGYIIGPKYSSMNFAGGVFAWLFLIPLIIFVDPDLPHRLGMTPDTTDLSLMSFTVWYNMVRPMAVGAMLVASCYTLFKMRSSLVSSVGGVFSASRNRSQYEQNRIEKDMPRNWVIAGIVVCVASLGAILWHYTGSVFGALITSIMMVTASFILSAVGSYLVGVLGNTNQPLSGLTLVGLVVTALVMSFCGLKGASGVMAALAVTTVIASAVTLSGDMVQDLKVGHMLGGTPWKMQVAEGISVVTTAFFMVAPLAWMHMGYAASGGIGGTELPAPQAALMASVAKGILGGQMPWMLIFIGMALGLIMIMVGVASPMIVAVGMYLPFETTFAFFIGGLIKWLADKVVAKRQLSEAQRQGYDNRAVLVASGFVAGESLIGVLFAGWAGFAAKFGWSDSLAGAVGLSNVFSQLHDNWGGTLSLLVFGVVIYSLVFAPLKKAS